MLSNSLQCPCALCLRAKFDPKYITNRKYTVVHSHVYCGLVVGEVGDRPWHLNQSVHGSLSTYLLSYLHVQVYLHVLSNITAKILFNYFDDL